jgi:hypothetical protein
VAHVEPSWALVGPIVWALVGFEGPLSEGCGGLCMVGFVVG